MLKSLACLSISTLLFASCLSFAAAEAPYPMIVWNTISEMRLEEIKDYVQGDFALRDLFDAPQAHRLVVIKEDLDTNNLADNSNEFRFLVERVLQGAKVYNKLETSINSDLVKSTEPEAISYHLDSYDQFNTLLTIVQENAAATKTIVIQVSNRVTLPELDDILYKLDAHMKSSFKDDSRMILLGNGEKSVSGEALNLLQQSSSRVLKEQALLSDTTATSTITCSYSNRTYCINQYINNNALNGVVIGLFCTFFLIIGMLCLFYIQTPAIFASSSIDFGKIEK